MNFLFVLSIFFIVFSVEAFPEYGTQKNEQNVGELNETGIAAQNACERYSKLHISTGGMSQSREFPWMAALGYLRDNELHFDCGGIIISERFILTAAHCVKSSYRPTLIRLGTANLFSEEGVDYEIQEIIGHQNYSSIYKWHDIALIRLTKSINFTDHIRPACLQTDLRDENNNVKMIVTGWSTGWTEKAGRQNQIRQTELITMPLSQCNRTFLNYNENAHYSAFRYGISAGQYCAYDPKGKDDSCQGDSGGPLQYFTNNSSISTVVGIVSFGVSCGTSLPGLYTRVAYYLDWIESIVWPKNISNI